MKTVTKSKRRLRAISFGHWTKKISWNSVHYKQSYKRSCWPTLSWQCAFSLYPCIWVRATWLWCRGNFTLPPNFPQLDLGRRADSRWALPQISSYGYVFVLYCIPDFSFQVPATGTDNVLHNFRQCCGHDGHCKDFHISRNPECHCLCWYIFSAQVLHVSYSSCQSCWAICIRDRWFAKYDFVHLCKKCRFGSVLVFQS